MLFSAGHVMLRRAVRRRAEIAHEVYATPHDSVTGWPGFSSVGFSLRNNARNSRSLSQRAIAFFHPQ